MSKKTSDDYYYWTEVSDSQLFTIVCENTQIAYMVIGLQISIVLLDVHIAILRYRLYHFTAMCKKYMPIFILYLQ